MTEPGGGFMSPEGRARGLAAQAATRATKAEREARIDASEDPWTVISTLFKSAGKLTITMYDKANRTNKVEDRRFFMEASRETRLLADRCLELIRERGTMAEADDLLEAMDARLEETSARLEASLAPVAESSS